MSHLDSLIALLHTAAENVAAPAAAMWLRAGIVTAGALAIARLARRRDPGDRLFVYGCGFVMTVIACAATLLPAPETHSLVSLSIPESSSRVAAVGAPSFAPAFGGAAETPRAASRNAAAHEVAAALTAPAPPLPAAISAPGLSAQRVPYSLQSTVSAAAFAVWLIGISAAMAWLALGQMYALSIYRGAAPLSDEATEETVRSLAAECGVHCPEARVSDQIDGPFVMGILRPRLILPGSLLAANDPSLVRSVIAHELHHIRSNDVAWALFRRAVTIVLWPQPLLHLAARLWQESAEEACDTQGLRHGASPERYARYLLSIAESRSRPRSLGSAAVSMARRGSSLGRRLERILGSKNCPQKLPGRRAQVAAALALTALMAITCSLVSAQAPQSHHTASHHSGANGSRMARTGSERLAKSKDSVQRQLQETRTRLKQRESELNVYRIRMEQMERELDRAAAALKARQSRITETSPDASSRRSAIARTVYETEVSAARAG